MKTLITILIIFASLFAFGQNAKPSGTLKLIQSPAIYYRPADSLIYMYKGLDYSWNRLLTIRDSIKLDSPIKAVINSSGDGYENLISVGTSAGTGLLFNSPITNSILLGYAAGQEATNAFRSNFIGYGAGGFATNAHSSNFIGDAAGNGATNAYLSNFIGASAGVSATGAAFSNFIGTNTGLSATGAQVSNFIGYNAGNGATNAANSNFIGNMTGALSTAAQQSNFIGYYAGYQSVSASFSNFIGKYAGSGVNSTYSNFLGFNAGKAGTGNIVGNNNIIIGTNISLPNATTNALNIGGVLFGKCLNSSVYGDPTITPTTTGSIGIGIVTPTARLHLASGTTTLASLKIDSGAVLTTKQKWVIENDGTHLYYTTKDTVRKQLDNEISTGGASYLYSIGTDSVEVSTFGAADNLIMGQCDGSFDRYTWFDGEANAFFGSRTTPYLGSGSANAGIGSFTGYYLYNGNRNFFGGYASGSYLTNGNENTLVGASTGYNPASESTAAYQITTDSAMTLVGYGATKNNTAKLINGIAIGAGAHVTASNQAVLGNANITSTILRGRVTAKDLQIINNGTGADTVLISTYKGNNSLGYNIWIGNGGQSSVGEVATNKGAYNSFFGSESGKRITTGYYNTGSGYASQAWSTTGYQNTGIGVYALLWNATGDNNTAIGYDAGTWEPGGSLENPIKSTFIGANTKALNDGNTNEIVIGYNAVGNGSNTVTIGNTDIDSTFLKGAIYGIVYPSVTKTAAYTAKINDHVIICLGSGTYNITLPTAMGIKGKIYTIKKMETSNTSVVTTSSQTIDGATSYALTAQYSKITVMSDGANWIIL